MSRLPLWKSNWDTEEKNWNERAKKAKVNFPIKDLKVMPQIPGITEETAKGLKWKSLKWMIQKDSKMEVLKGFLKHPMKYGWEFLKSAFKSKPYKRQGDFFLYGVESLEQFEELIKDKSSVFILGFSYCHKPFECPSGRFTSECIYDDENPVCQQCFIGKTAEITSTTDTIFLIIPTIHYIGGKIFEIVHEHIGKNVYFIITACELTLEMFGDWGNMVNIRGLGVRLDGRICNTMKAFELSEQGIKPGLTVVLDDTQQRILEFLRKRL
ncbi:MAG: hypothetical protein Q8K60_02400 [Parachlamydiaceae bacterium]|nr:hypothetical protein [Parachlamydiaceae bacterium]